jgi:WD40 repeat protein
VSSPSDTLILSASRDGTVRSWRLQKNAAINPLFSDAVASQPDSVDVSVFSQHSGFVNSLAFHPDGMAAFFAG